MPYYTPEHYKDPTAGAVMNGTFRWVRFDTPKGATEASIRAKRAKEKREQLHRAELEAQRKNRMNGLRCIITEANNRITSLEARKVLLQQHTDYLAKQEIKLKTDFSAELATLRSASQEYTLALATAQRALRSAQRKAGVLLDSMTGTLGEEG